jgi:hypothetical protein
VGRLGARVTVAPNDGTRGIRERPLNIAGRRVLDRVRGAYELPDRAAAGRGLLAMTALGQPLARMSGASVGAAFCGAPRFRGGQDGLAESIDLR